MATGIETRVGVSPGPVQVPNEPDGVEAIVVQLWVRSGEGSWSGCLPSGEAEELARLLADAARRAEDDNELARRRRVHRLIEQRRAR